ncbi:hypothetical protein IMG5_126470 [Ichthyophthirius multifiliis]|uniref:Uncharacterized protein n=1 Tax=Ichthyophthirius multifiliis TaxID=5932 RepID=G0QVU4_ICHMU|nr:hypothetical protein IMG5_126470 [Ichthyophthirius multifiliis]EGR30666.1 hypothetical protein IMG5_126470 [Ichthyophthirius multifiliis]|eukprot:XP_004032253.1 hypothetical protein IMG5_126470 [Ichthyophthirius multifiliis]
MGSPDYQKYKKDSKKKKRRHSPTRSSSHSSKSHNRDPKKKHKQHSDIPQQQQISDKQNVLLNSSKNHPQNTLPQQMDPSQYNPLRIPTIGQLPGSYRPPMMNPGMMRGPMRPGMVLPPNMMKGVPPYMSVMQGMKPPFPPIMNPTGNFMNTNPLMGGQEMEEPFKKIQKMGQQQFKKGGEFQESFVVFKNYYLVRDLVEVLQNCCLSVNLGGLEIIYLVCQKALEDMQIKCKDSGLKQIQENIQNLLVNLNKDFKKELKKNNKESIQKDEVFLKNIIQDVKNIDYLIIKLINENKDWNDVFNTLSINGSSLDLQNILESQVDQQVSEMNDFQQNKLYQECLKLFQNS